MLVSRGCFGMAKYTYANLRKSRTCLRYGLLSKFSSRNLSNFEILQKSASYFNFKLYNKVNDIIASLILEFFEQLLMTFSSKSISLVKIPP